MKIITAPKYTDLSKKAFQHLLTMVGNKRSPLICTASGDSPKGLYQQLTSAVVHEQVDVSHWNFVSLDEWAGMNGTDEGSCRFHLDNDLYLPAAIPGERLCFFDGRAHDLDAECNRVERYISDHGGIDVAVVGLGLNGHVGMNEPGTDPSLHLHVAQIHPDTQAVGQKYFTSPKNLEQGLTLGIASLMEARHVMMIVSGEKKAAIVKKIVEDDISEQVPATLLRNHKSFVLFVDKAAATLL